MSSITLKVKPAVFRWIDNNFPKQKGKYDVRNSWVHEIVIAGLVRRTNNRKCNINKDFEKWKSIELIISAHWVERFGLTLTDENMCMINRCLYKFLTNEICYSATLAHVHARYPKHTMFKKLLFNYRYEENELNVSCISKIYQRKYLKIEKKMCENLE
jgi:hypothetical protein